MAAAPSPQDRWAMQATTHDIRSDTAIGVEIRPLDSADRAGLAAAFARLSDDTRWRRFHGLARRLGERDLDRLTRVDHHRHEALAAIAPESGAIVGVARYVALPDDPRAAEVAVAVDDGWQGRGIGRRLMAELVDRARAEGVTRLLAYVSVDNHRVLAWIERAGGVAAAREGEAIVFSIPLDRPAERRRAA
jgi:RimJ/RimL family protein N-acetyltransferase